ncbi:TPA: hypothetical protein ACH3X3_007203 [Trebouxia sp. C0006]
MCTFKPFQSVGSTSDNSSGSFGVVVMHELPAIDAQSYDSDDTFQNQEVEWRKVPLEDVSSRASPEVLGAVDLLSLKRATWGKAAPFQTQLQVSRHPDSDYGCPATLGHTSVAWCSDDYLHASAPLNVPMLLPGRNDANTSTSGGHCCMKNIHTPLRSRSQYVVPYWHSQKLSRGPIKAECTLNSNRSSLQHKTKGRGRDPACIKEWAALTTWLRMNLHQARTAKRQVCFVGHRSHELGRYGAVARTPCTNNRKTHFQADITSFAHTDGSLT